MAPYFSTCTKKEKTAVSSPWCLTSLDSITFPQALKSATYYDLNTDAGYPALHRALTNQPRVEKLPLGQSTKRLPSLGSVESQVFALLIACPDPLPLELVACVAGQDVARLSTTLQRLRSKGVIAIAESTLLLATRNVDGIRNLSDDEMGAALRAALDFLKTHPNAEGRAQIRNVVTLQRAANLKIAAAAVSPHISNYSIISEILRQQAPGAGGSSSLH